jgi:hypothetical protein
MRYANLPAIGTTTLPELAFRWTPAKSSRPHGVAIEDVFLHRWGITAFGKETIDGVLAEFLNPANEASAHLVYAGEVGRSAGRCVQMVRLADKAWTEAADNAEGVSVECGDAMWLGHDPEGFARAARIAGWLLRHEHLPAAWVRHPHTTHYRGVTRHADGGVADGGHTVCPTADLELWRQFVARVKGELLHGGYRAAWAR